MTVGGFRWFLVTFSDFLLLLAVQLDIGYLFAKKSFVGYLLTIG